MPSTPGKVLRGAGRVAFLARIEAIRQAIGEGYTLTAVYSDHEKHLGISYSQFARYVSKFISHQEQRTHRNDHDQATGQAGTGAPIGHVAGSGANPDAGAVPAVQPGQPAGPAAKPKPGQRAGFTHDPDASNRRDLI